VGLIRLGGGGKGERTWKETKGTWVDTKEGHIADNRFNGDVCFGCLGTVCGGCRRGSVALQKKGGCASGKKTLAVKSPRAAKR